VIVAEAYETTRKAVLTLKETVSKKPLLGGGKNQIKQMCDKNLIKAGEEDRVYFESQRKGGM